MVTARRRLQLNHFYEEERKRLSTQVAVQKAHYGELTEKIEESARQRHDMRHHMLTLYQFLEKGEAEQAMHYLAGCDINQAAANRVTYCKIPLPMLCCSIIKTCAAKITLPFWSPWKCPRTFPLRILISQFSWQPSGKRLRILQEYQGEHPFIKIRGKYGENGFLVRFENTFSNPLKETNGKFYSTKHNGPGIGTESVKKVVQQYQGTVEFAREGHVFQVSIILPI